MSNLELTGTITGTGPVANSEFEARVFDIILDFAGTATVQVQVQLPSDAWMTIPDPGDITADYYETHESAATHRFRLNCSAFTNNVEWVVKYGSSYEKHQS